MSLAKQEKPTITPSPNGPYVVKDLETLRNSEGEKLDTQPAIALCRCGGSANKPFCDGTHAKFGFSDAKLELRMCTTSRAVQMRA